MSGTIQIVGRHVSGTRIAQRLWPPHRRGRAGCRSLNTRPPGPHRDNRHGPHVYTRLHTLIRISTMAHDRLGWLKVVTHNIGRNKDRKGATKIVSAWAYICTHLAVACRSTCAGGGPFACPSYRVVGLGAEARAPADAGRCH